MYIECMSSICSIGELGHVNNDEIVATLGEWLEDDSSYYSVEWLGYIRGRKQLEQWLKNHLSDYIVSIVGIAVHSQTVIKEFVDSKTTATSGIKSTLLFSYPGNSCDLVEVWKLEIIK